jgi:uncharacterized protein (DUF885 family)
MRLNHKLILLSLAVLFSSSRPVKSFSGFVEQFMKGYAELNVPGFTFDYRDYFSSIASIEELDKQLNYFNDERKKLTVFQREKLPDAERVKYDNIVYEIGFNAERIALEKKWIVDGRKIPLGGLHDLSNRKDWYSHFIKKFTSLSLAPEQVFELGKTEVARVKSEMDKIRQQLGFSENKEFYIHLKKENYFLTDKKVIVSNFAKIDSIVRKNLESFIGKTSVPPVYAMEWPDDGPATPPGIYLSQTDNSYGKDVFQFNFFGGKYNKRAMEWLYMHEAIPGHHLQSSLRRQNPNTTKLAELFLYPGNFEGWGCYVEYFGKDLGLYSEIYSLLGKWEWDLVRSARLVIDAGIHYYGWTHDQALEYWKATIPGQDDIAEREVNRVTNWAGQTVSYKAGADFIFKLKDKWQKQNPGKPQWVFHQKFLAVGPVPLEVVEKNIM